MCSTVSGLFVSMDMGAKGFFIGFIVYLLTFYLSKGIAHLSTAPIDFITESPINLWISRSFVPWVIAGMAWFVLMAVVIDSKGGAL